RTFRHDDIQPQSSQLGSNCRKRVLSTLGKTVLDDDILPFDPTVFLQSLAKCLQLTSHCRRARVARQQKANPANRRVRLLRARREWPRSRAAEQRDEIATFHVEHGDFLPDALSALPTGPCPVFRSFSLPQGGRQVLGANLKCSESRRGGLPLICL